MNGLTERHGGDNQPAGRRGDPEDLMTTATSETRGDAIIVRVMGQIGMPPSTETVDAALGRACTCHPSFIIVDLSAVPFVSSLGIGILVTYARSMSLFGGRFAVAGAQPAVADMMGRMRLEAVFPIAPDVETALAGSASAGKPTGV